MIQKFDPINFKKRIRLVGLEIKDNRLAPLLINNFNGMLFNHKDFRAIQKVVISDDIAKRDTKVILIMFFSPTVINFDDVFLIDDKNQNKDQEILILKNTTHKIKINQIDKKILDVLIKIKNKIEENYSSDNIEWINGKFELLPTEVLLTCKNFTAKEILSELLPKEIIIPSSFEQIGHIAHLNLIESQLPYKYIIGDVFLETNRKSGIRTIVNKVESLSSEFRELHMEIIAGTTDKDDPEIFTTKVKQHGNEYIVPINKVYWNSRLEFEHKRFVDSLSSTDILYDVMAGVGPFSIPAGLKGIEVYANDLNQVAIDALNINWEKNRNKYNMKKNKIKSYTMDGRKFIEMIRMEHLIYGPIIEQQKDNKITRKRHFVMNLPTLSVTFLDSFTGPQWKNHTNIDKTFFVHIYLFSSDKTMELAKKNAIKQIAINLKIINNEHDEIPCSFSKNILDIHYIRDISPQKYMFLVSFKIPENIFDL